MLLESKYLEKIADTKAGAEETQKKKDRGNRLRGRKRADTEGNKRWEADGQTQSGRTRGEGRGEPKGERECKKQLGEWF